MLQAERWKPGFQHACFNRMSLRTVEEAVPCKRSQVGHNRLLWSDIEIQDDLLILILQAVTYESEHIVSWYFRHIL